MLKSIDFNFQSNQKRHEVKYSWIQNIQKELKQN